MSDGQLDLNVNNERGRQLLSTDADAHAEANAAAGAVAV